MSADFAKQSTFHVAILPDGNGRWALARGLPRPQGHRAGVDAVCRVVRAAPALGIDVLTLHALSRANLGRPAGEVRAILACIRLFLEHATATCVQDGVRIRCLGRRDRLPTDLVRSIEQAERESAGGGRMLLRLAIDYSAREAIRAAFSLDPAVPFGPDVDLLIRTGGERRLSDFQLWECAWAELVFVDTPWPDFGERDLAAAVEEFRHRERRWGGLPETVGPPAAAAEADAGSDADTDAQPPAAAQGVA